MTTPQTAQALADEAKWLAETYGDTRIMASRGRATREEVIEAGAEFHATIDRLAALATQTDTERANWKRWCELAEAATQAEAPVCPDPAGCLREGCNQNGDGSLCERYVEAEAPAAPAQAVPPIFWVGRISKIAECCDPDIFFGDTEADVREKAGAWNSRYEFYPVCAATPPQAAAPAQADAADDLIHRLHAEANKADDVHADLMREAAEALAATPAQPAPVVQPLTDAARDVLAERQRQIVTEGWTPAHDDQHRPGQLASAAACYVLNAATWMRHGSGVAAENYAAMSPINWTNWPWVEDWWKPKSERRDLVRAAALILAEIERLDRAHGIGTQSEQESGNG